MSKHLLLFGDASGEKLSAIQDLVRNSKTIPAARRFLQEATNVVRHEFSQVSRHDHGWNKKIHSLLAMAEQNEEENSENIAVSGVLLCIGRLGKLIVYADEDPSMLGSYNKPVEVIALCAGLLSATVVMAAADTSQLFSLSSEIISVSFRMGIQLRKRMKLVEDAPFQSWGRTYTGISREQVQGILDKFHESQNIPGLRRIAIAVVAKDWLTLIAPPSSLTALESWSADLSNAPQLKTQVPGPIHSKCLPQIDTAKILGNSILLRHPVDLSKARMISPGSCVPYKHITLGALLEEVIHDIVHNVLHVTETIEGSITNLGTDRNVKLSVMGQTNYIAAVKSELKAHEIEYNQVGKASRNHGIRSGSGLVAIVGMAGRFPENDTVEGFWEDLLAAKCHIKEIPRSRFDIDAFFDATGERKNSTTARHGAFLKDPGLFDHRLFNMSPREAAQIDPGHRLLLTISYEALQSAGYSPDDDADVTGGRRIATYFGQAANDWQEIMNQKGADIYYVPGVNRAFGPGRLNFHYKWDGGSYALDSACSTSATAVSLACSALVARECDMALAGGVSVLTSPNAFSGLSKAGMLSENGGCRTYHDDADGYARGEGAGAVVLKRLEDAQSDNDNILGVIRGWVRTYSSTTASMTRPDTASQQATYNLVLQQSALNPSEIAFVEMHGTGTQTGDEVEMTSVINTFARRRIKDNTLTVGAVKAAVGHGEGAAGVTSIIKVLMMLRDRVIPPQPGWPFKLNRKFPPLTDSNVRISMKRAALKASPEGDKRMKILVNSFDASGGNVSLVIEEAPPRPEKIADPRAWHLVAISARSEVSLQRNRESLLNFLERHSETKLSDLAYTTTARRIHESLRYAYVGATTRDVLRQLQEDVKQQLTVPKTKLRTQSCVFLCSGQGSQYAGMGSDLFRECPTFRESLLSYQEMATNCGLPHFIDLISGPELDMCSQSTTKIQMATVALEIAIAHLLKTWGIIPNVIIGHSLGEYAALAIAGVLSISDVLLLVGSRGLLMEEHLKADNHAMLVTNLTEPSLGEYLKDLELNSCSVACANAPYMTVASGSVHEIDTLKKHLEKEGTRTALIPVPYGFHSSQVEPILNELEDVAKRVVFRKPHIPVVSTLTGQVVRDATVFSPTYLVQQARQKVAFVDALQNLKAAGLYNESSLWIEIGPKPMLLGFARQILDIPAPSLLPTMNYGENNWRTLSNVLKRGYETGVSINWLDFHRPFQNSIKLLDLPLYAFDSRDFWTSYATPSPESQSDSAAVDCREPVGAPKIDKLPNSSVQYVTVEKIDEGRTIEATLTSKISNVHLLEAINGHVVNGHTICPLAIFHNLALSASKFGHRRMYPNANLHTMSLRNVVMTQAMVIDATTRDSLVQVIISHSTENDFVDIKFESKTRDKVTLHGTCQVIFDENPAWKSGLPLTFFLVNSRMETLREQGRTGKAHRLLKPVVYALFSHAVNYSPPYQGLEEVIMDSTCKDAIGTVKLSDFSGLEHFHQNPYWTDAVTHLAGFILNSGLRYPPDIVCVAVGFQAWRSIVDLLPGRTYTSYVCMQEVPSSQFISGDCYVFDGQDLVQATLGIKFLKVKKIALNTILGMARPQGQMMGDPPLNSNEAQKGISALVVINDDTLVANKSLAQESHEGTEEVAVPHFDISEKIKSVLSIVVAESGCNSKELTDDTRYSDLGVDSLMAMTLITLISRNIDLDLPASFFMENETIGESKTTLEALLKTKGRTFESAQQLETNSPPKVKKSLLSTHIPAPRTPHPDQPSQADQRQSMPPITTESRDVAPPALPVQSAKVVHYQGSRQPDSDKLFFIADETGSTFEYIRLPSLGSSLGVFGIDLPFLKKHTDVNLDVKRLADLCRTAIQKEQPSGPYMLGGISAGAMIAFEVARGFLVAGKEVRGLMILDSAASSNIQDDNSTNKKSGFAAYHPDPLTASMPHPRHSFQIMAKDEHVETTAWVRLLPGLQTLESCIESGSFLKMPMVKDLGQICKRALESMRERAREVEGQ